jgi:NADH:ubiquinone oxidoreductase subunit 5 (subunit L)/multisubunit Na+/H+ antiporter MnhA subunit
MLLGWGTHYAVEAAAVGVLAHALYKGAMFLIVGGVDHAAHTRDIRQLSGLRRAMPISAALMGLAAGSMAGLPLWFGFIAKELLLEAALRSGYPHIVAWLAPASVVLASWLNVAIAWRLFHGVFLGRAADFNGKHVHDPRWAMLLGPGILVVLSALLGAWPWLANGLAAQAASAILGKATPVKLALWHGLNTPLLLSLTALAAGTGLYAVYGRAADWLTRALRVSLNSVCDGALDGLYSFAQTTTRILQSGADLFPGERGCDDQGRAHHLVLFPRRAGGSARIGPRGVSVRRANVAGDASL